MKIQYLDENKNVIDLEEIDANDLYNISFESEYEKDLFIDFIEQTITL